MDFSSNVFAYILVIVNVVVLVLVVVVCSYYLFLLPCRHDEIRQMQPVYLCLHQNCLSIHCWKSLQDKKDNHLWEHISQKEGHSLYLELHSGCVFCLECEVFYSDLG